MTAVFATIDESVRNPSPCFKACKGQEDACLEVL